MDDLPSDSDADGVADGGADACPRSAPIAAPQPQFDFNKDRRCIEFFTPPAETRLGCKRTPN
jgi:hypothetical protein